ncbi:Tcb3p Ecym_1139 [Eremothecium cymbalariae DBVPG|uniref:Tricalbin n=1 Tax=Eremothecium cymbalariae (strain CBS 270.75 / DBVPG 7215 / KCTC 17166 / NRRL Y-17582) TaxID=931890 RepID=G8JMN6_ERECY|nr:hypothetical protein Ecym_1139 [Eremothecium cymbalariae DBVPG\
MGEKASAPVQSRQIVNPHGSITTSTVTSLDRSAVMVITEGRSSGIPYNGEPIGGDIKADTRAERIVMKSSAEEEPLPPVLDSKPVSMGTNATVAPEKTQFQESTLRDSERASRESQALLDVSGEHSSEDFFPWSKVGSFAKSGKGSPVTENNKLVRAYITEILYNDWYHNTGVIVGTCFFAWLLSYCGFCWWALGFVFFCTGSVYRTQLRRFQRNIRDDLKRVDMEETLGDRLETSVWLNTFLAKFWVIYMPVLSQQVKDIANPQLAGSAPGFGIDALSLDEFTLGTKAPTIDNIRSYPKKGKDVVEMDWKFSFTPNDVSDMTAKQAESKVNPKIALGVTVGKSFVSKSLPVLVEDINVAGKMRITLKFGDVFPNIKTVSVSFLEPPLIDFALKPVGGDTLGLDIMSFLPGLKTFVKSMIDSNARPMLYAPNHYDIDVEELMEMQSQDAVGIVAVTLKSAKGFKSADTNCFISLSTENTVTGMDEEIRSAVKYGSSPTWDETKFLLINSLQQKLYLKCFNQNSVRKNTLIGETEFDLSDLYQQSSQEGLVADLKNGAKSKGLLKYDIKWFPVAEKDKKDDSSAASSDSDDTAIENEEANLTDAGILKFTLHKVKYLNTASSITGSLSPCGELFIDGKKVRDYRTLRHMNEPSWEDSFEILIPSKRDAEFSLRIYDERINGKTLLCEFIAPFSELMSVAENDKQYVTGSPQGEIYFSAVWKSVPIPEDTLNKSESAHDPLGGLRIHIRDALVRDELEGVGDVDPYFMISSDRSVVYKSNFYSETSNPTFDDIVYIPITSEHQIVTIDLFDYQKIGKDRFIGTCHLTTGNLMPKDPTTNRYTPAGSDGKILEWTLSDKSKKATGNILRTSVTFIPTFPVYAPHEIERVQELEKKLAEKQEKFDAEQANLKIEMEKNPSEYEVVEVDVDDKELAQLSKKEKMTFSQLVSYNSGIISFKISTGKLSKNDSYLQILCDDFAYPASVSGRAKNGTLQSEHGEYFVRDLQHSITTFRVTKKPIIKDIDDVISEVTIPTLQLLNQSYDSPTTIDLKGSTVDLVCLFSPSATKLPDTELITDTGILELDIVSAENLPAHDRNGMSDPFTVIKVDGTKLFKTEIIKKSLSPVWNANTKVPIASRTRSTLIAEVYDWDRSGSNDLLCTVRFPLSDLVPLEQQVFTLPLVPQGRIYFKTKFTPDYIRPAVNISEGTFASMPLKAVGTVANFGLGVAGAGVGAAANVATAGFGVATNVADFGIGGLQKGGRLLKGVGSFKSPLKTKDSGDSENKRDSFISPPNATPNNSYVVVQSEPPHENSSSGGKNDTTSIGGSPGPMRKRNLSQASSSLRPLIPQNIYPGRVTLLGAEGLGKSVQVRISLAKDGKMKHLYRSEKQKADATGACIFHNEICEFKAPPEANLVFGAVAHHTFSKDTNLGVAQINMGDPQLKQDSQVSIKLGSGHIIFKIEYAQDDVPPLPPVPSEYTL